MSKHSFQYLCSRLEATFGRSDTNFRECVPHFQKPILKRGLSLILALVALRRHFILVLLALHLPRQHFSLALHHREHLVLRLVFDHIASTVSKKLSFRARFPKRKIKQDTISV
ncbi:hypothetical protein JOQ06_011457 [Pogonophryne albipinna]|uniref:Uncharacterized protein n=1 Tax=Pogonophryne albipinna TaxID=1090488 RepID=A0AAD6BBF6_9TELE|nr:hypothetical protein JOQ06_011457 [Pogonophryne albipinna]